MFKLYSLFFVFALMGCSMNGFDSVTPILIARGNITVGSVSQPIRENFIVSSQEEWSSIQSKISAGIVRMAFVSLESDVDFTQYTVLALFDGQRSSGGYFISVNIVENAKSLYVNVTYNSPASGILSPQVLCQPYLIIKIPKTSKSIIFE